MRTLKLFPFLNFLCIQHRPILSEPNPVLDATLAEITDSSFTVSWKKPDGPITGFRLECKRAGSDQSEARILDSEKTSVRFSGLEAGAEYTVEVFSLNKSVESEAVALAGKTTSPADPTEDSEF